MAAALEPNRRQRGFGVSAKIRTLVLEFAWHEKVKESFRVLVYQASLVLSLHLSSFQALHLQYVFAYIIGITSTLAPLSISTKPCGLDDSKITLQIPCLFQDIHGTTAWGTCQMTDAEAVWVVTSSMDCPKQAAT